MLNVNPPSSLSIFGALLLSDRTFVEIFHTLPPKVVRSNQLVKSSPGDPWLGAHDTTKPVVGFTYKV